MWREESEKSSLVISKRLRFPLDDRTDPNFIAPLIRMYFLRSKSTLDSLKSVFNVFRRKPRSSLTPKTHK